MGPLALSARQRSQFTYTVEYSNHPESTTVQSATAAPCNRPGNRQRSQDCKETGAESFLPTPPQNNDRRPTSQKVIVIKDHTDPEPPGMVSITIIAVALCIKKESGRDIAHGNISTGVENFQSERTEALAPEVLIGVLFTGVDFFPNHKYKIRTCIGVHRSALYSMTCLVDTGAGPNIINEAYPRPDWESRTKRLDPPKLGTEIKELIEVQRIISVILNMETPQLRTQPGVVQNLAVAILLGPTYFTCSIKGIFPVTKTLCR